MPMLSRRTLLLGGGGLVVAAATGAVLLEEGVLPGRAAVERELGMTGPAGTVPTARTGGRISGTFTSAARGGLPTGWTISYPPGSAEGDRLPVVVSLHGYGGDHRSSFDHGMHLDRFQAASRAAGGPAVAIASVDGGNDYWHRRTSGRDPQRMLVDEFLPLLRARGLDTARLGLFGWSMGAYGALLIGSTLGPERVRAVAASSVALWPTRARAASGAFDSDEDFARNDLAARTEVLGALHLRVACGTADAFCPGNEQLVRRITPAPVSDFPLGAHDWAFWRRVAPDQVRFLAQAM
jgi:enterochelin esterase-like enzyme